MAAFNKAYNSIEVSSILSRNGYKFDLKGMGKYPIDFVTIDKENFTIVKSRSHGVSIFLCNEEMRDIGLKSRIWAVNGLFPIVNGKPDYDNQIK
jgi:hypothetical protein